MVNFMVLQAAKAAGMNDDDIGSILKMIKDETVKQKLKETTNYALEHGVCFMCWSLFC